MAEGYTATQLAQEFGLRSDSTFGHYLKRHGITPDLPNKRFSEEQAKTIRELRATRTKKKKADIAQIPTPDATPVDELTQAVTGAQEPLQASFEPVDNETPEEPVEDASTALVAPVVQPDVKNSSYREDEPQPISEAPNLPQKSAESSPAPESTLNDENHSAAPKDSENFSATDLSEKFPVPTFGDSAATPKQQGEDAPSVPEQNETSALAPEAEEQTFAHRDDELSTALVDAQEPLQAKVAPVDDKTPVVAKNPAEGEKKSPDTDEKDSKEPMNEFNVDFTINPRDKQSRVAQAQFFFDSLIGNVTGEYWGYLWTVSRDNRRTTHPFKVTDADQRAQMAKRAIELSDAGLQVYFGVNLAAKKPSSYERFTNERQIRKRKDGSEYETIHVVVQTSVICDIDIEGGTHEQSDKKIYAPDFDTAKSFLPFTPSLIVNSGYGIHAYLILAEPLTITNDNRQAANRRNVGFIKVIRSRAGDCGKTADSVGDLARVLRVPGTFNYKLGISEDAPLCRIVEANGVCFTPADLDERIAALLPKQLDVQPKPPTKSKHLRDTSPHCQDDPEYDIFRATKMLEVLSNVDHKDITYNQWLAINTACKNIGVPYSVVDAFNQCDPTNYNAEQNRRRWEGLNDPKYDIETIHGIAKQFGYDEKAVWHEWHDGRKENTPQQHQAHLSEQTPLESSNEEIIASIREACEWRRNKDADGNFKRTSIKPTYANIKLIFENDPNLRGLVGYDQFQGADVFLKRAPWHDIDHTGEQWNDDAQLRMYLRANYAELKEKQLIEDAVIEFSRRNSFNAVQQFLEALPQWDGIPRAETLFIKFLHAEDSEFTRKVTMNWLLGAIARVYHPGCDFQICLVLQGAQRIGKSKLVKMLGGKEGVNPKGQNWHVALKDSVDDAHAVDALQKGWIIEIEEFSAARRAEINALKSYISADDDTRRFAYDRRATTRKRNVVFVVTCNDEQFLRDPTGNARFIIIKCSQKKFDRVAGMTPEYIRQVWAEVLWKYKETFKHGFNETKLQLPLEHQIQAEKIAEAFMADDGLTNEIQGYLNRKITAQIVWQLLTKEERRKFIADGNLRLFHAYEELTSRRKARGKKDIEADLDKIHSICTGNVGIRKDNDATYFYGTEYRNHICAAEIHNECFGNDPRKRMNRINEILSTLEGWTLGERLRKADPEYPDQKKPYYRDEGKLPPDEEDTEGDSNTQPNDFIGETLSLEDPPF